MSSPFDLFRRNSKILLAVFGVILMFVFVVGGSLQQMLSHDNGNNFKNNVVATWSGGSVRELELRQMEIAHQITMRFLQRLAEATQKAGKQVRGPFLSPVNNERQLMQNLILAEKAKQMGIYVNDDAVKNYLSDFCSYELSEPQIIALADEVTGRRMSVAELFHQLRIELAAHEVRYVANSDLVASNLSVADAWDYHNRLFRKINIEAYPFVVSQFEGEVTGAPNEADKRKIFDEFRLNEPDPDAADPGFYHPLKLAFAYVKIDFAPFLEKAKKEITDEKVREEYDKQVKAGQLKVPVEAPKAEPKEGEVPSDLPKEGDPKAEKKDAAEPAPSDDKKDDKDAPPAVDKKSGCEADEDKAAADEKKEDTAKKDDPAKKDDAAKTEESDAPKQPAKPKEPEMRVQTYEEAKDALLTQLARPIANEAMEKAVNGVMTSIREYSSQFLRYTEFSKRPQSGKKVEKPAPIDIEAIAKKYGFEGGTTPLVNRYEVLEYDLGRYGRQVNMDAIRRQVRDMSQWMISFPDLAYDPGVQLYNPAEISSSQPDVRFVYCVTDKQEPKLAAYDDKDVQQAVIAAWKKGRALELAKKAAAELADKAKKKDSLKDVAKDPAKIIAPPEFTYFTFGAVPFGMGSPRYGSVEGIAGADREFLESVYLLPVGDTTTAMDRSHSTVYAVKVLSQDPAEEVLREQFLESGVSMQLRQIANLEFNRRGVAWLKETEKEYGLHWDRQPGPVGFHE